MKPKQVASLTIKSPGKMSKLERKDVIDWLRRQADHIAKQGDRYTLGRFRAGLNYER